MEQSNSVTVDATTFFAILPLPASPYSITVQAMNGAGLGEPANATAVGKETLPLLGLFFFLPYSVSSTLPYCYHPLFLPPFSIASLILLPLCTFHTAATSSDTLSAVVPATAAATAAVGVVLAMIILAIIFTLYIYHKQRKGRLDSG